MQKTNERIKIGLFIDVFYPMVDGVVVVVDNYAKRLQNIADVIVFAPKSRDKHYKDQFSYPVVRSAKFKVIFTDYDLSLPFLDAKYKKQLNHAKLDIVHIHSPFSIGQTGIRYAKKHHIPVIATLHSQYKQDFLSRTKSKMITEVMINEIMHVFNQCDACYGVNQKVSEIFLDYGAKIIPGVLANGTDLEAINDLKQIQNLREQYQIQDQEKVLLFVGRIDILKNILFTVDALKLLKQKQFPFKMIFVGSGPHEKELQAKIKKHQLENEVILTGKIMDRHQIALHYALADLFVFPSLYDSSSLVQIEAASQKTPTLFIKGAATAHTITENVDGYFSSNDVQSYADKIIEIFADSALYQKVSEQANKRLFHTWDQVVLDAYQLYLRHIEQRQANQ